MSVAEVLPERTATELACSDTRVDVNSQKRSKSATWLKERFDLNLSQSVPSDGDKVPGDTKSSDA